MRQFSFGWIAGDASDQDILLGVVGAGAEDEVFSVLNGFREAAITGFGQQYVRHGNQGGKIIILADPEMVRSPSLVQGAGNGSIESGAKLLQFDLHLPRPSKGTYQKGLL
ncbi:MAG: hypothetical protein BWX83_01261 [Candidatus Cloacimonetes bacterium ADurb.Bin117]|nr:MAG: hypothetical protein BWX83_01261 [Candidatus Cloacimonetes bacterium ADurb.Bin117]